jgi:hypothetical protein
VDTLNAINQIGDAVHDEVDKTLTVGDKAIAIFADKWSFSTPLITSYDPAYVGPSDLVSEVVISVHGVRLHPKGTGLPTLRIGDKVVEGTSTATLIEVVVPRSSFPSPENRIRFETATLTIGEPGFLSTEFRFSLLFSVLPSRLGEYTLRTLEAVPLPDEELLITEPIKATKNGGGSDTTTDCYKPKKDFLFDPTRASIVETKRTAYKDKNTSPGTNYGKIGFHNNVKFEEEICIFVTAATGCTECGGTTEARLEVPMVRTLNVPKETIHPTQPITWKEDVEVTLLPKAKSQTMTIRFFDDIVRRVSATSPDKVGFIEVKPDLHNGVVFLIPRREWYAR